MGSILTSVKDALGLEEDFTAYDANILLHINSTLAVLNDIGIGAALGFEVEDKSATWEDFLGDDPRLNKVKTYVYTKVRLLFDPPATSFGIQALESVAKELETRIYLMQEVETWRTFTSL